MQRHVALSTLAIALLTFCRSAQPLPKLPGDKYVPVWARDANVIAFSRDLGQPEFDIFLVDADGKNLHSFFGRRGAITDLRTKGRTLFQESDGDDEIHAIDFDGANDVKLTNNEATDTYSSYSSDRKRIAFLSNRGNAPGSFDLWVMNADGSGAMNISGTTGAQEWSRPPMWSPDDQWIVFSSNRDGDNEIYRCHPDGRGLTQLTTNEINDFNPSFSPDGSQIAFISTRKGTADEADNRIFVMNADGSGQRQLGDVTPIHGTVSWSPRGDRIVFNTYANYVVEVFSIGVTIGDVRQITFSPPQPLIETLKNEGVEKARALFAKHQPAGVSNELFYVAAMRRLGAEYLRTKDFDRAIAAFTFNTEAMPAEALWWNRLGAAYRAKGDTDNADRAFRKALELEQQP